jgi:hypothetical protein
VNPKNPWNKSQKVSMEMRITPKNIDEIYVQEWKVIGIKKDKNNLFNKRGKLIFFFYPTMKNNMQKEICKEFPAKS